MASFLRSISTKIFGIAVGLLLVMLLVSFWSAEAIHRVNRQLATLSEGTLPLTLALQDLRSTMLDEYIALERYRLADGGRGACQQAFARAAVVAQADLQRAKASIARGTELAITERNKLELARMQPLVGEMAAAHDRYAGSAARFCAALGSDRAEAYDDNQADAQALGREIDNVSAEIVKFTQQSAMIVEAGEQGAMRANLLLIAVASVVGLFLAYLVSRGLTRPIQRLREGTRAVEQGRLDRDVIVTSRDEIGDVTRAFNEMLGELRTKERIKETFGQYVDPRVVAQLIGGEAGRSSSGTKQVASLFFSDIAGFTPIAERLAPAALVTVVNDYFATMSAPIRERSGIIDKYIGDSIMAFWVPPFVEAAEQATQACEAALVQFDLLKAFRMRLPDLIGLRRDIPHIDMRVAIATGEVVVGSIGPDFARSFTVMGDTVNFASRLEGANKVYGTHILIDEATARMAGSAIETREIDLVQVVGRSEPLRLYELVAMAGRIDAQRAELFALYAAGVDAYRAGAWGDAEAAFAAALAIMPDDGPSRVMLERIRRFAAAPPAAWDGVWRMTSK